MRKNRFIIAAIAACALAVANNASFAQQAPDAPPPAAAPAPAAPAAEPAPAAPSAAPTPAAKLSGIAAWNAIIGNTITGKKDGDDFDYYVKADGTIVWLDDGDIETGKWALEGEKICVTFPDEDKECYKISMDGDVINFLDDDGSGFRGTLLKGNPKKL